MEWVLPTVLVVCVIGGVIWAAIYLFNATVAEPKRSKRKVFREEGAERSRAWMIGKIREKSSVQIDDYGLDRILEEFLTYYEYELLMYWMIQEIGYCPADPKYFLDEALADSPMVENFPEGEGLPFEDEIPVSTTVEGTIIGDNVGDPGEEGIEDVPPDEVDNVTDPDVTLAVERMDDQAGLDFTAEATDQERSIPSPPPPAPVVHAEPEPEPERQYEAPAMEESSGGYGGSDDSGSSDDSGGSDD